MPSQFDVVSTSAGEMFLGALVPGLVLVALYMLYILIYAVLRPHVAPPVRTDKKFNAEFFFQLGLALIPPLSLIFLVLGSIITGVATVNQAGAIGAAGALLMAGYRLTQGQKSSFVPALISLAALVVIGFIVTTFAPNIKAINTTTDAVAVTVAAIASFALIGSLIWSAWRAYQIENTLQEVMVETAKATSLVFIILLGAAMLTAAFRAFGGEELVKHFLEGIPGGFWAKFITVMAVIFILGFFLDFIEIAVVVVPIVAPILLADPSANITAVWLGVMIGLNIQTSFLTPPFGFALFYLRGVAPAIVKTIDMYKGVIAFIGLQLAALVIVANFPPLVNYLPNRVSFLAETAPPPRNPRIQYCVEEYIYSKLVLDTGELSRAVDVATGLDTSFLPKKVAADLTGSFEGVAKAKALLEAAKVAEENVIAASVKYRPLHRTVRALERDAHVFDAEIKELETTVSRLRGDENAAARDKITQRIAKASEERDALLAQIPSEWAEQQATFQKLTKEESNLRNQFRRTADSSYQGTARLVATLKGSDDYIALEQELTEMRATIESGDPKQTHSMVSALSKKFSMAGAEKIKSGLGKARRALKRKKPDIKKALKEFDRAQKAYTKQLEWRAKAKGEFTDSVSTYEVAMRDTIGMRQQQRMTREQGLSIASCQSNHRDISLNF